jgi:hypothetical protein
MPTRLYIDGTSQRRKIPQKDCTSYTKLTFSVHCEENQERIKQAYKFISEFLARNNQNYFPLFFCPDKKAELLLLFKKKKRKI